MPCSQNKNLQVASTVILFSYFFISILFKLPIFNYLHSFYVQLWNGFSVGGSIAAVHTTDAGLDPT